MSIQLQPLVVPTGIPFIDAPLGGGQLAEGVHGLLGPTGIGKTTLGAMLMVEGAIQQFIKCSYGLTAGAWVYITFDERSSLVNTKRLSYAARIARETLDSLEDLEQLSNAGQPRPYEVERAVELTNGEGVLTGEFERYSMIAPVLSQHTTIVDRSMRCAFLDGGVVQTIQAELMAMTNPTIAGVIIDYAGLAIRRFLDSRGLPPWRQAEYLGRFAFECRELLARQFHCPVWVLHQLAGDVGSRNSNVRRHHVDAEDCRRFGADLDACFVMGTKDTATKSFRLDCSKALRGPGSTRPVLLQADRHFWMIAPAEDAWFDVARQQIVPANRPHIAMDAATRAELDRRTSGPAA